MRNRKRDSVVVVGGMDCSFGAEVAFFLLILDDQTQKRRSDIVMGDVILHTITTCEQSCRLLHQVSMVSGGGRTVLKVF